MNNYILPTMNEIERRILIFAIQDFSFFREFFDRFGNYKFTTRVRRMLYETLKKSRDGSDLDRLVLRKNNHTEFQKFLKVYKIYKKSTASDNREGLIKEFGDVLRHSRNIGLIKDYVTALKSGEYEKADTIIQPGFDVVSDGVVDALEVSEGLNEELDDLQNAEVREKVGEFGYLTLDKATCGIWYGDAIMIFGRPGVGKSILLMNIMHNNRIRGRNVAIINLEMENKRVRRRYLSRVSGLEYTKYFKLGKLDQKHRIKIKHTMKNTGSMGGKMWIISVKGDCTLGVLQSIIRDFKIKHNVELFGIDFMDCVRSGGKSFSEQHELGVVAKGIKSIANDNHVGIIEITHMNMGNEDVEESGDVQQRDVGYSQRKNQYCDISMGMIRTNRDREEGLITIKFVKGRDTADNVRCQLRPRLERMKFEDIEKGE